MKVLEAKELAIGYRDRKVVEGVNFKAFKGQFICLLGPNGSGKSTLLRCLAGLLAPQKGAVYLKGQSLYHFLAKDLAKHMAVVLTERVSVELLRVFDLVAMGRYPYTGIWGRLKEEDNKKVWEALNLVHAQDLAFRYFGELSDGEKQKVLLARALAQDPELIILDEPTTHLDVRHRLEVTSILRHLSGEKGITIIASLHDLDLALKTCELAILVKNGKILAWGPPEEILTENIIAELYDIKDACFNEYLGSLELKARGHPEIYVFGGGGRAATLYRILAKRGFGILTGVIHENDIDYYIARAIGATIISERPFEEISLEAFKKASKLLERVSWVVDAGYPVGLLNRRNLELLRQAVARGKEVYTLRSQKEAFNLYGNLAQGFIYCSNWKNLIDYFCKPQERPRQEAWAEVNQASPCASVGRGRVIPKADREEAGHAPV
ncbi:iron complex transport system ATP-binding protein [Thermanaeromonas toyohensis ToBE]|uniref:Iron complex transport system ATP-binding protein n=1 Tax=Thermanaeromonas toyohensis ToBE TaxID=698762 RepID=A0A1W1VDA0_9FIRM|nr:ABC transporter ATP-binding protein [Thermanaeromonas toyohensis]SMB91193.1 iron complex transport system ATP-binding protein [Thermanaeromonas toyohensis ToBE]